MIEFVDMSALYRFTDPLPDSQVQHGDAFVPLDQLVPQGFAMGDYRHGGMAGWFSDLLGKKKSRPVPASPEAVEAQAAAQIAVAQQQMRAEEIRQESTQFLVKAGLGLAAAGLAVALVRRWW